MYGLISRVRNMSESDVEPIRAGEAKPGKYIVVDGDVYVVKSMDKGKSGKHGHAKARIRITNIFTGKGKEIVMPTSDKIMSPKINKSNGQVLSISDNEVQIMDLETYEYHDVPMPYDEEIKSNLVEGGEVEYWQVMGRYIIVRAKS